MEYELNEILTVEEMMELINVGKNTAYLLLERGAVSYTHLTLPTT